MNGRDKINALWLTMELTMNALEQLGEDPRTEADAVVRGTSAELRWDVDRQRWTVNAL